MSFIAKILNGKAPASNVGGVVDADLTSIAENYITSPGIVYFEPTGGDFYVTQNGTPDKTVNVAPGTIYVLNSTWARNQEIIRYAEITNTALYDTAQLTANASGNPRIDVICVKYDNSATPNNFANNVGTIQVVIGIPGASPVVPAIPNNYEPIAQILLPSGYTSITNSMITDIRRVASMRNFDDGWKNIDPAEIWTYASAWDPANPFTTVNSITCNGDKSNKYNVGQRIRLKQTGSNAFLYFFVANPSSNDTTLITDNGAVYNPGTNKTTVYLFAGTDYILANLAITNVGYTSDMTAPGPIGFHYTPVFNGSVTNPTIGNGTLAGWFTLNGRMLTASIKIQFGSTSTLGSGNYGFGIPIPATNAGDNVAGWIGAAHVQKSSDASNSWNGSWRIGYDDFKYGLILAGNQGVSSTTPFTFVATNADLIAATITVRI